MKFFMVYLGDSYYQNKFDNKTRLQNGATLATFDSRLGCVLKDPAASGWHFISLSWNS